MNNDPYQTDMDEAWEQAKREQADGEYINKKDAMEFFKYDVYVVNELNNMPSVAIPSVDPTDENLHREREQAYMQGYEDASKRFRQEPCDDAISRQAVNTLVDELARAISDERCCMSRGRSTATIMQDILDLPPVKPQEPYKGMTNREVIMALFPNPDKIDGYFSFTEEWANAPYTGEE